MFILAEIVCDKQIICLAGCTAANWDFYFMLPSTLSLLGSPLSVSTFIHTIKSIMTMVYYLFACLFVFVVVFFWLHVILLLRGQMGSPWFCVQFNIPSTVTVNRLVLNAVEN